MVIDFPQPTCMRGFCGVVQAPTKLGLGCFALSEEAGEFRVNDTRNPVDNKDLAGRQLLGSVKHRYRLVHVTDPVQERNGRCMLGSQKSDRTQIERLLRILQLRLEFLESRRQEFSTFTLQV